MSLSIILIVIFAMIVLSSLVRTGNGAIESGQTSSSAMYRPEGDKVEKNRHVIDKKSLKLLSYKEALEASKQFIYDITRAVLQRFLPDAQQEVTRLGKVLVDAGMKYFHVVDIMSLSIAKSRAVGVVAQKTDVSVGR